MIYGRHNQGRDALQRRTSRHDLVAATPVLLAAKQGAGEARAGYGWTHLLGQRTERRVSAALDHEG